VDALPPEHLVRQGYDTIAEAYLRERRRDSADVRLLDSFIERLPPGARVLDAGCGAGQPITALLATRADTIGIDFSKRQLLLARSAVSSARLLCADLNSLPFRAAVFDGICSYYAIIHIPRERHAAILSELRRALRTGGLALLCLGANDLPASHEEYFGVEMFWSHFDAATNLRLLADARFEVLDQRVVIDESDPGGSGHLFVLARAVTGPS
jgi:SAM-dependent methyltransferase